jgi:predicted nuclease with TOPRIM domain
MEKTELTVRSEYEGKMESRLKEFGAKLDELMAKGDAAKEQVAGKIEELKANKSRLATKLAEMRSASEDAWSELKPGLDRAVDELGKAFSELKQASERAAGKLHK